MARHNAFEERVGPSLRVADFTLDEARLEEVLRTVWAAVQDNYGIFEGDMRQYLPQWNLPASLEYSPQQLETKDSLEAARFLWTRVYLDRRMQSRILHAKAVDAYNDDSKRWIFDSQSVSVTSVQDIDTALLSYFGCNLPLSETRSCGDGLRENARRLHRDYVSDPRMIIHGRTVEEGRRRLMEFDGIGTGIANLFLIEMYDRRIAEPTDAKNLLFKVDVHKGRIPINTGAVIPMNGALHSESMVDTLEQAYRGITAKIGADPATIDAALWVIGSEVCARKNVEACWQSCPLYANHCKQCVTLDGVTGKYRCVENGKLVDGRRGQSGFLF